MPLTHSCSPALVSELVEYRSDGTLWWKDRQPHHGISARAVNGWNRRYARSRAFKKVDHYGYLVGALDTHKVRAHHIVWCLHHGAWPKILDHINGDRTDNRIENLREVTPAENSKNMRVYAANKSGFAGVRKRSHAWCAEIQVNGKNIHLGSFQNIEDAVAARRLAERQYGFHDNHATRRAA